MPRAMKEIVSVEQSFNSSAGEVGIACTWEGTGWCLVPALSSEQSHKGYSHLPNSVGL